jgi:hypothetical protein
VTAVMNIAKRFTLFPVNCLRGFMKNILIILLTAIFSFSISGQTPKKTATQVENTKAAIVPLISDEEYKVYGTVLGKEKGKLVIRIETNMDKDSKNIKMLEQRGFEPFLKQIKPETMRDFLTKNDGSELLEKKISPDINYTFISTEELKANFAYKFDGEMDWEAFRQKYPNTANIYTLSRVGFSQDSSEALVFVTNWCRSLCGEGNYYVMKKENCEWKIVNKMMTWIS